MLKLLREYISILLTEAKSDQLKLKFPRLEPEIDELIAGGVETKYLDWAVKQLDAGSNINELIDSLNQFHKNAQRIKNKDINSYDDLESLRSIVDSLGTSKRQVSREILAKGSEKIGETDEYKIYYVDDVGASKKLGSGTKWCISGDEADPYFWEYYIDKNSKGSRFYFCISKTETIETDPKFYKIAIIIAGDKVTIYDAQDDVIRGVDIKDLVDISLVDYRSKNRGVVGDQKLVKHHSQFVRELAANKIDPKHLPQMMDDPEDSVRMNVFDRIDPEYLPQAMNDPHPLVRWRVARRIDPRYLPQMVGNSGPIVRSEAARRIDPKYLHQMINDPDSDVRWIVATRVDPKELHKMIDDPSERVRKVVAVRIDPEYLSQMMDGTNINVDRIVKSRLSKLGTS